MPPSPKHSQHAPKDGLLHPYWLLAVRFFIALAFLIGSYLLLVSWRGIGAVGCGPESGCDKVLHSRWAYWFGIPVSLFALAAYLTLFITTFRLRRKTPAPAQRLAWSILVPGAILVVAAGLWFFVLQWQVIKAFCPYCMAAHGSGLIASLLILFSAPFAPMPDKPWQREKTVFVPRRLAQKLVLGGLCGVALLVSGQMLHQKKSFVVTTIPGPGSNVISSAFQLQSNHFAAQAVSNSQAPIPSLPPKTNAAPLPPNPNAGRWFVVYNTNILNLRQVPMIGSPSAPYIVVSLHDYTCHHCQLMHGPLLEAYRAFSNQLGIVTLPMPLDPTCNPSVKVASGPVTNGCHYARLALAVWRANPAKMSEFDDWMFASNTPPALSLARAHAAQLVGSGPLEQALRDPWIEQQLRQNMSIYEFAQRAGRGSMPQIIIGRAVAVGTLTLQDLFQLLADQYGLKK